MYGSLASNEKPMGVWQVMRSLWENALQTKKGSYVEKPMGDESRMYSLLEVSNACIVYGRWVTVV